MKKGFTLIELIISIVIIGIAASVLPTMIASANKLEEDTLNQDVFFKSVTVLTDIASRYWDDPSSTNGDENITALIWHTNTGDTALEKTSYRDGSIQNENFRYFFSSNSASDLTNATHQIKDSDTGYDNINQYQNGYIDETASDARVRYDIKIDYVDDKFTTESADHKTQTFSWKLDGSGGSTSATNSTNLKRIRVTASGRNNNISFVYFSSNIGTAGIKKQ